MTHPSAVEDHPVAEQRPFATLDQFSDGVLDLDRVLFGSPAPAPGQPAEMGVDGDARNAERVAEHHICGFAADSGEFYELFKG